MNDVELEDLISQYGEETVAQIIEYWQENLFTHPMTCRIHSGVSLVYEKGKLFCPVLDCPDHQHWIPKAVVDYWKEKCLD